MFAIKETAQAVSRKQKNVLEQNTTKARSADWCFAEAEQPDRAAQQLLGVKRRKNLLRSRPQGRGRANYLLFNKKT